jgi:hypothetical protein
MNTSFSDQRADAMRRMEPRFCMRFSILDGKEDVLGGPVPITNLNLAFIEEILPYPGDPVVAKIEDLEVGNSVSVRMRACGRSGTYRLMRAEDCK